MSRVRKPSVGLATLLVGVYLILSAFSVGCAINHMEPGPSNHHHGSRVSHSSFCAWACLANPASDAGPAALVLAPFFLVLFLAESTRPTVAGGSVIYAPSRAPPIQL
jgi:hypothetical protein